MNVQRLDFGINLICLPCFLPTVWLESFFRCKQTNSRVRSFGVKMKNLFLFIYFTFLSTRIRIYLLSFHSIKEFLDEIKSKCLWINNFPFYIFVSSKCDFLCLRDCARLTLFHPQSSNFMFGVDVGCVTWLNQAWGFMHGISFQIVQEISW